MDNFKNSEDIEQITDIFQTILSVTKITPDSGMEIYHQIINLSNGINWCKEFQNKINEKLKDIDENLKPEICSQNIVIVGAGPGGLVSAFECALMGAKVHVIEKRTNLCRNNILHIWPYTVHYLTTVGAKIFYPKFAVGGMDHIGTKQIQRVLLKINLLLGVRFHFGHNFTELYTEDGKDILTRCDPPLQVPCNVLIGADGVSSSVAKRFDFHRVSFTGTLSIGITFNLKNNQTPEELALNEFAVTQIYNQSMFKDFQDQFNITLENIVYYRGETHYFVMTIKKNSLFDREVFKEMKPTIQDLLDSSNINEDKLLAVARDTAKFCGLPESCEVVTIMDKPDVQLFDFSERIQSDEAIKLVEISRGDITLKEEEIEHGARRVNQVEGVVQPKSSNNGELPKVLITLVGDALLEPFWPLGTGLNRAILSALDAAWVVHQSASKEPAEAIMKTRQGCYLKMKNALAETFTTPYKVCVNPHTRYNTRCLEKDII
jgi:2-polyprenyl-6-methoxyphenol hydroxylase-like FAD-dependent oxidoreductase